MLSRPRGVVGMVLPDQTHVIVLARDSRVYVYERTTLKPTQATMGDAMLRTNSAFASIALSPCRRWIAAGGLYGTVVIFNVEKTGFREDARYRPTPVCVEAPHGEINGIAWTNSGLVTCADDGSVRMWRMR